MQAEFLRFSLQATRIQIPNCQDVRHLSLREVQAAWSHIITKPRCRASDNAVLINNTNKLEPNPSQGVLECNIVMVSLSTAYPVPIWGKPRNYGSR